MKGKKKMKIGTKILAAFTAASLALSLTACSDSSSRNYSYLSSNYATGTPSYYSSKETTSSSKAAQSYSSTNKYSTPPEDYFVQSIANQTPSSSSKETPTVKKYDFVGFKLNEAVDILKDAGLGNYVDWKSDDGKTIIAKSNWTIKQQQVTGNKIMFICTKTSSGISNSIKATAQKALAYLSSSEGRAELAAIWDGLKQVNGIAQTLKDMFS